MMELSRLSLPRISVSIPSSLAEAVEILGREKDVAVIAGGTHVIHTLLENRTPIRKFVDISRLDELKKIHVDGGRARVGALVTHSELAEKMMNEIRAFKSFMEKYSAPTIANIATVGGSVMLKKSSEDLIPILLTLDAELTFADGVGVKKVSLDGYLRSPTPSNTILTEISFNVRGGCVFDKLWLGVSRNPLISVAAYVEGVDRVRLARVAVSHRDGSTPGRVVSVERFLEGRRLEQDVVQRAGKIMSSSINPSTDVLASSEYRREVAAVLLRRLLTGVGM
jgi:CO/xanthine dehydrogenase FAD-binding subunit